MEVLATEENKARRNWLMGYGANSYHDVTFEEIDLRLVRSHLLVEWDHAVRNIGTILSGWSLVNKDDVERPVEENPVGASPVGENPVGENPVGENPVGENPIRAWTVGESPFVENPVGENPVGENPVGEIPVEENP